MLARPDLRGIESLDRHLYGMLRNLYVSHLRRATRAPAVSLTAVEYDSAEIGLRQAREDRSRIVEELWGT